ncbi:MAG: MoxR family ATPase [Deltaproteobacteria bacterium]|nr:MoxR family ATPase [Deltaproteobacteria bacterium]
MATERILESALEEVRGAADRCAAEIGKAFIGARETVDVLLTALLARGHVLLEGVPGVAKTTLCKAFSRTLGCRFRRIQFTPDLLPSDITGTYIFDLREQSFVLREGPVFAHVILGDEINRAPAKTQSALLEAMQEGQVTIEGTTRPLPRPFMVLATQNPIEHEGTYPLPEAQVDRFLVKLPIRYPSPEDEKRMLATYNGPLAEPREVLSPEGVLRLQELSAAVHVDDELLDYVLQLVHFTRRHRRVYLGASPRAALALVHAAKGRALLAGRDYVLPDDAKHLAPYVLAHRVLLTPEAELEGVLPPTIVAEALDKVAYRRR